jgi:D-alanyl-D-alanine carboxypeptidase
MPKFLNRFTILILILFLVYFSVKNIFFSLFVARHNTNALTKLKTQNAQNYETFYAFIEDVEASTDWHVYITSTYRTTEQQARLKKQDARNASAGHSKHNQAKAIDLVLFQDNGLWQSWVMKGSKKERWQQTKILDIAKKHQLIWGGTFRNYYDPVHFEID